MFTSRKTDSPKQLIEYVWLGGSAWDLRGKTRVLSKPVEKLEDISEWNFDGSSTELATTENSEILLKPVRMINDPFRGQPHKIVLCDTYFPDGRPTSSNFRELASRIYKDSVVDQADIWFGVEQEYILCKEETSGVISKKSHYVPAAWTEFPKKPQGDYYCGVGSGKALYRNVPEEHLQACLKAGLDIAGINAEVFPGQWEYQLGICKGLDTADQLWLSRYLLYRVCESHGLIPVFDPKPVEGDWNGSGCHVNISTKATRDANSDRLGPIKKYMELMSASHTKDIECYGENNALRLTGKHETSSLEKFSWGVGSRGASVRIPFSTEKNLTSYFEDRRPAANMDPYLVCAKIADTLYLSSKNSEVFSKTIEEYKKARAALVQH